MWHPRMPADPVAHLPIAAADKPGELALVDLEPLQGIAKLGGGHRSVVFILPTSYLTVNELIYFHYV
jgi:hypothetical protein